MWCLLGVISPLKKYALEDRLEIKRELEIIQPDIIVCGNNLSLLKLVLGEELQNDDTWDNMLALWKDTLVLDYYHPAVHYPNCNMGNCIKRKI